MENSDKNDFRERQGKGVRFSKTLNYPKVLKIIN